MKKISSSIAIAARQDQVWDILVDFASYASWNPFIQAASGAPIVGHKLRIRVCPPDGKPMSFTPKVLIARPNKELRWKGRLLMPGIFDGEHYFRLKPAGEGTLLEQGKIFSGLFVGLVGPPKLTQIERGFHAMNEALRRRTEAC